MFDLLPQSSIKTKLNGEDVLLLASNDVSTSEQIQLAPEVDYDKEDLSVFFGIGMIVNIVMITSFFIWAVKQWKKNDTKKK